jgi:alkanesulfonate monooxygenase SsuD/methylene tetrahydromethanopterin reductase-like flavin-dependent oxidoreductase (luciferase family)
LDPAIFETGEWRRYTVGRPESVRDQLTSMARALGVDEIMAVTIVHSQADRIMSYRLLAEAFDLVSAPSSSRAVATS